MGNPSAVNGLADSNTVPLKACSASSEDADKAVAAAKAAFVSWSKTNPTVRRDIFIKGATIFEARKEELASYMKDETGAETQFIDFNISTGVSQLKDLAGRISGIQGFFPISEEDGRSALVLKEPYGVILAIAPWNAPYILGCRSYSFALAAGNTVVLKGSELAPRCFHALVDVFHEAGLLAGCLNLLFTQAQEAAAVTTALIANPDTAKINFTGSTAVGSIIAATAGKHLKLVLLELLGPSKLPQVHLRPCAAAKCN